MASAPETIVCSICLTMYTDAVSMEHNFCPKCIDRVLNTQGGSDLHSCPAFKEEPEESPSIKSAALGNLNLPLSPLEEPLVIPCSYCIHSSAPAVKTCLHCEAFLCDDHLRVHIKSPEHVLSAPSTLPEDQKCSIHKKILEYYCNEDQTCICVYCLAETHRTHHLDSLHEATEQRKKRLKGILETLDAKRDKADEDIQNLLTQKDEIPDKATSLTESVMAVFSEIRRQLEDLESKALSEISRQKEQVSASISDLIQQLEIRKDELSMEIRHIEKLLRSTDAVTVLQNQVVDFSNMEKNETVNIHSAGSLDDFLVALILYDGLGDIVTKAKEDFYPVESPEILLDQTTAANNVAISEDLKSAMWSVVSQRRRETPRRFQQYQVFSIQGINSGRHYWEVETSEAEYWMVGMAYPSMETNGDQSWIGNNKKSWCFCRWHDEYSLRHDGMDVQLFPSVSANRCGVHVGYDSGRLSFYELCDPIRHLHTFYGNFSEPLHAAFWVNDNGWIKIRKL
ncbi:E3 ubiquitin/ISG15 ligase TRIM25-like [Phyllobates terribilis]|uniref:E3 ubiquitin/ISG15 ligase TRIM25-like n=1 Tax=Phyllobates terribilis TaxID=111132 RepID=UPI003CCB550B